MLSDLNTPLAIRLSGHLVVNQALKNLLQQGRFRTDYALNKFSSFSLMCHGPYANKAVNGLELHDADYVFDPHLLETQTLVPGIYIELGFTPRKHTAPLAINQLICSASSAMEMVGTWNLAVVDILIPTNANPQHVWALQGQTSYLWDDFAIAHNKVCTVNVEVRTPGQRTSDVRLHLQQLLAEVTWGLVTVEAANVIEHDVVDSADVDSDLAESTVAEDGVVDSAAADSIAVVNGMADSNVVRGAYNNRDAMDSFKSKLTLTETFAIKLPQCKAIDVGLLAEIVFAAYSKESTEKCLLSFQVST